MAELETPSPYGRGRRRRPPRSVAAGAVAALVGSQLAMAVALAPSASAAVASPPAGGHSILVFPQRDFISAAGYAEGQSVLVQVIRNGIVVGTSHATATHTNPADPKTDPGLVEVNHPAATNQPQNCWEGVTPDIRPGDLVQVLTDAAVPNGDATTTANVTASPAVSPSGGTIVVHGTAQDVAGNPLPVAQIEQRMVANKQLFEKNGRRTLRATNAPGSDGTLDYDPIDPVSNPRGINWTATYTGLSSNDVTMALDAETRGIWLGRDPAALVEQTLYEVSPLVVAGPQAPCAAPFASGPSAPTLTPASDTGRSSTDGITRVATPTLVGVPGTAPDGATVNLYDNPAGAPRVLVGSGTVAAGQYSITSSALADGTHQLSAEEIDPATSIGTTSATMTTVVVDTAAPAAPVLAALASPSQSATPQVKGSAEADSSVQLFTGACATTGATGDAATLAGAGIAQAVAPNAETQISAKATDVAGNVSACSNVLSYTNDTVAPSVTLIPPASPTNAAPQFSWTTLEATTSTQCSVDTAAFAACASPLTVSGHADGTVTLRVRATDAAGNVGSASATVRLDTTLPVVTVTGVPAALSNASAFTPLVSTNEPTSAPSCTLDGTAVTCGTSVPLTEGAHNLVVSATDLAGNAGRVERLFTIDRTAPALSGVMARALTAGTVADTAHRSRVPVLLSWPASPEVGVTYALSLSSGGAFVPAGTTTRTSMVVSLTPGLVWDAQVVARDAAGNSSPAVSLAPFRVDLAQDSARSVAYAPLSRWGSQTATPFSGGTTRWAAVAGTAATYTFTGRTVALVSTKAVNRGRMAVLLDGRQVAVLDMFSRTAAFRQVVYRANGLSLRTHTLQVRPLGTHAPLASSSRVDVDAFISTT